MKVVDLSGQTFGALLVLRKDEEATKKNKRGTYWCKCSECNKEKLISSDLFRGRKPVVSCGCRRAAGYTHPRANPTKKNETRLLNYARRNARRRGEECSLELKDIVIPEYCPVLGIKLQPGSHVIKIVPLLLIGLIALKDTPKIMFGLFLPVLIV